MQAVILVAGKSTRTYPLTLTRPKPMLPIANKTIIEHNLEQLTGLVNEVILIVGYRQEMIREFLGQKWGDINISYCEQKEQLGTGHAVLQVEAMIRDRFLVLNGDDVYAHQDMQNLCTLKSGALVKHVENPSQYGVYQVDENNRIVDLVEKPRKFVGTLTNIGCYLFTPDFFDDLKKMPLSERGEYEITWAILNYAHREAYYAYPIDGFWLTNGYPWELLKSQEVLMAKMTASDVQGTIEAGAVIKGAVVVGEGTIVKSGSYIEGPVIIGKNCTIGPNCFIRTNSAIGDNCRIGHAVEIKNSIIMDNSEICHLSYVGDSVIDSNVTLGAGFISANVRHDQQNVKSTVKARLVDSGMSKLGTIIANGVKTGIHTSVLPGRKMWPNTVTRPGQVVIHDIMS
jgi:UDP-N-acetylglucosamine diphosphorylase/glucosamine-1-phosphate N-acetyltransferase